MGTGSSKQGDTVVKFEESDDDSWARDDKQAKKDDKSKKEERKESVFGKVFSKNKPAPAPTLPTRKIVGESSSSDEEDEYHRDVQLRNDIHQLERALNNVDDDSKLNWRNQRTTGPPVARYDMVTQKSVETDRAGDGLISRGGNRAKQIQMRKRSDLKFSWDDRDNQKMNEDWSIQKVKIEGFDPAKFKAANNNNSKLGGSSVDLRNTTSFSTNLTTIGTVSTLAQPPGFVPTYDRSEQQLMASLEQELGF